MIELEIHKNNLDTVDKFGVKNIIVDKSLVYSGEINYISKKVHEELNDRIPPLAAAILGLDNTAVPLPNKPEFCNIWTDIDAQELYLNSKPTCYLILSKPGAGAYSLGEAISKKLSCVHLCPRNVIIDETDQKSSTGKCLDFNMRHNNVCKFDNVLSIIKKKLESPGVKHRGYVLSGLPLITSSKSSYYVFHTLYSEEAILIVEGLIHNLICNLKRKKPKKQEDETVTPHSSVSSEGELVAEEEQEPEAVERETEEQLVELPKFIMESCSDIIFSKKTYFDTKKSALIKQLDALFNLKLNPDIIIYITCPDIDLVTKKTHKFYNYVTNINTTEPFFTKSTTDMRWPTKYMVTDYTSPYDSHIFSPKYNCKQPINFIVESVEQMCNYKQHILHLVENKLKDFVPKHIIKLDGRTSVQQMVHHIIERLVLLPIKPVLIPEPLYLEDPPEDMEEFWKLIEELNVIRSGVVNFSRYASPWFNRCPVELKKRHSVRGNPKFAVTFFKHVYLLSSLDAMISFFRNPRPYLKAIHLEPTCRIIVIGTKSSGKTMISKCLSWIFDAPVICFKTFVSDEKKKKYETFAKTILSEIIATIEDARLMKWQSIEVQRFSNLEVWYNSVLTVLKSYIPLLKENVRYMQQKGKQEEQIPDFNFINNFNAIRNKLYFLSILDDVEQCEQAVLDKNVLLQFAPIHLITATEKPTMPVLGDQDVTEAISAYIVANELQKEIEPTPEELITEMVKILTVTDVETQEISNFEKEYGRWIIDSFPSDPEYWEYLNDFKLLPDNTISLIENREIEPELIQRYVMIEKCLKNHEERFLLANDPLIKVRLRTKNILDSKHLDMQIIVHDIFNKIFDSIFFDNVAENTEFNRESELLTSFSESLDKFREDWDTIKLKLEENFKSFIEVQLEEKSDVEIAEEVLLKLRKSYYMPCTLNGDEEPEDQNDEDGTPKDIVTYNSPRYLSETSIYCPIVYYDFGVLWEGKAEFSVKYDNKIHYFCKEECLELFQKDVTKYQSYNKPFKKLPPLRICVIGCIGSGKTTVSKQIAKELGLIHIDFAEAVNEYLMPKHFKKVGRSYENSFTDVSLDEEAVVEFQMDEENRNLESDLLSNELELRRMVYNYFERGAPLLSLLTQKLIKRFWFQNPFLTTGFVLDGFPRLPSDVENMIACFCIPDLIIELEGSSDTTLDRLSLKMFKRWKMQLNEAKKIARIKYDNERRQWMDFITKNVVVKLILDDVLDNIFFSASEPLKGLSTESVIIDAHPSGSSNVDANLFNSYNEMILEYPEPVEQTEWEKADEVRERIDARLESIYEVDDENIQILKDIVAEQKIKIVSVDAKKSLNKVLRIVLTKLSSVRSRCESFFEQTFIINCDIAEILLLEGFYFLSKFNRMCPVYIFENPKTLLNPYKIYKHKGKVYPVVHRSYIYFINGEDYLKKFRINPLKYINSNIIKSFLEYPLRIGVIGPPKSGKSTLAAKLAKRYGLICISRGAALRYILENMYRTELSSRIITSLRVGETINADLITKAVQTITIDHRTMNYGFVFDGFPDSPSEAMELSREGLYPLIIFDLTSSKDTVIRNLQKEVYYNIIKSKPPYSNTFIEYRFSKWNEKSYKIRDWIKYDIQNLYVLNGNESRWQCLQNSINTINEVIDKVNYYLANVNSKIVPVDVMCISNDIFQNRMSDFKNMCPLCLRNNVLKHSGYPVDRKGVVQFRNRFYWICSKHMSMVMRHPECYLLKQEVEIPEIPAVVKTINTTLVYENGICIVTYAENLPTQKIERGSNKFAASFRRKIYLFCSYQCLEKFLAKPHMYYDIVIFKETKLLPKLSLKKLPNLGYLEQTVGSIITDACCSVNVLRPKYPGLSVQLSALLHIALYLKIHNPLTDKSILPLYVKAYKAYETRCKLIVDIGLRLRSMDNPFANYPKCCSMKRFDSGTVRKPSSFATSSSILSVVFSQLNE